MHFQQKLFFYGFTKTQPRNVFKRCYFDDFSSSNAIYSVQTHFFKFYKNHNPLVELSQKHEKTQKSGKKHNFDEKVVFYLKTRLKTRDK